MFFITEWLNEVPLMDLHDNLALVSILQRVFPYFERWCQRRHVCGVAKTNLTSSGLDVFLAVIKLTALDSPSVVVTVRCDLLLESLRIVDDASSIKITVGAGARVHTNSESRIGNKSELISPHQ